MGRAGGKGFWGLEGVGDMLCSRVHVFVFFNVCFANPNDIKIITF